MSSGLRFDGVSRRFGHVWALRKLSLQCPAAAVTCLIGPNGAGKSTALALAAGLLPVTAGRMTHARDGTPSRDLSVGYLPQTSVFPSVLRVSEVFEFALRALGSPDDTKSEIASLSGLDAVLHQQVGELSGGWVRRLGLACALLPQTGLVILDEPFVGLDPETLDRLVAHLDHRVARGDVVLLSTHDFEAVDRLRPQLAVLDEGRLVGTGAAGETSARALYRAALGSDARTITGAGVCSDAG